MDNSNIKAKLEKLTSGELTCVENVNYFLSNIKEFDEDYNIILELNDSAIKKAEELDKKRESGAKLGKLFGLVVLIKSNMVMVGMTTFCASKVLENYKGTYDADFVQNILAEDGIILGNVNSDEFASGATGKNSAFGVCKNPLSPNRVPGGSSSGSGACIAADFCDISLGSDTGGSNRAPASNCGVIGIKPSYGRVSRYGLVDLAMSFDQIGPFSNDVYGSALMMEVICGYSKNDAISVNKEVQEYSNLEESKKFKIGVIKKFEEFVKDKRILENLNKNIEELKSQGHQIIEIEVDNIDLAVQAYYPIVYTEFYSGTRKLDGVKYGSKFEEKAGIEALRRMLGGEQISQSEFDGAYYKKALKVKEIIANEFDKVFEKVDVVLCPTMPSLPTKVDEKLTAAEEYAIDAYTIPPNLAGICAGVIGKDRVFEEDEEISIGIQVYANKFEEKTMFDFLKVLESLPKFKN